MRKKVLIIILLIILLFISFALFSEKIHKIEFIENIKKAIIEENNEENSNITVVDVTNISMQEGFNHECIFFTEYSEEEHWKECKLCGKKQELEKHSLVDGGWTMGNTCNNNNFHKFSCDCGYNYQTQNGKIACNMTRYNWQTTFQGGYVCSKCRTESVNYPRHKCRKSNGSWINCINLGTCDICKYNYNSSSSAHTFDLPYDAKIGESGYCRYCNIYMGKFEYAYLERQSDLIYKFNFKLITSEQFQYSTWGAWSSISSNATITPSISKNGKEYIGTVTIKINQHTENIGVLQVQVIGYMNGLKCVFTMNDSGIKADTVSPTITSISKLDLTEWSKTKPITVTGIENYCSTVMVKIVEVDNEENIVFEGQTNVNNQNYSIECVPNIEVGVSGKKYKCIVTDKLQNSIEEIFEIAKVDSIPPIPTSNDSISNEWAKEKYFTFSSTDYGIGKVKIAFNDENDYSLAIENENNFIREYKFIGDVYEPKQAVVLYKDGLENVSSKEITLDKLDNTVPTITNIEIHNNKLAITSNDMHKTLGEGSGVVGYRYLTSTEKLNNLDLTLENSIGVKKDEEIIIEDVYKIKYIYVVAEDLVRKCK